MGTDGATSFHPLQTTGRDLLESEEQNTTPMRQQLPAAHNSYMSPKPPPAYSFVRTHSSPSILDASPKARALKRVIEPSPNCVIGVSTRTSRAHGDPIGIFQPLTPVTSNIGNQDSSRQINTNINISASGTSRNGTNRMEKISVPQPNALQSSLFRRNTEGTPSNFRNRVIRPRHDGPDDLDNEADQLQSVSINDASWLQQMSSLAIDQASDPFSQFPERRHDSPVQAELLHRSRESLRALGPSIVRAPENTLSYQPARNVRAPENMISYQPAQHTRAPENMSPNQPARNTRAPENMIPYQPARNTRIGSFGIVREDVQSIFHSPSSQGGGQQTSEQHHDADDTDISIPSIHHASRLYSTTNDSLTTINSAEYIDGLMEDESIISENVSYDEPQWGCFPNLSMVRAMSPQRLLSSAPPVNNNTQKKSTDRTSSHKGSRYMSPEKEREVFDWLHSLEVDKDNNDYVVEAASSKFLTGKINMEDEYMVLQESAPELSHHSSYDTKPRARLELSRPSTAAPTQRAAAPVANKLPSINTIRKKVIAAGHGSIAEYCGKERRLIVQSQCKRRKKRPVLRSCSGL